MSAENEDDDQSLQISAPLVFFCLKCKFIVGDSYSFLSSNETANTITLSAASNIQRTNELFTSYESLDEGSTYFCVLCRECQQTLGRYYVTTSTDLDHVRDRFTFSVDAISSYELGKAQHGNMPDPVVVVAEQASSNATAVETVQEDVTKIQHVLVDLVQRFGELEREVAALRRGGGSIGSSSAGSGGGGRSGGSGSNSSSGSYGGQGGRGSSGHNGESGKRMRDT